jgi:hypothetical protein
MLSRRYSSFAVPRRVLTYSDSSGFSGQLHQEINLDQPSRQCKTICGIR